MKRAAGRWAIVVVVLSWAGGAGASPMGTSTERDACAARPAEPAVLDVGREPRLRLSLAWRDLSTNVGPVAATVRQEVARIFAKVDVAIDWRTATPEEPVRDEEISVVVLPRPRGALPAHVMGAVNRNTGREAWIFVSAIERLLAARTALRGPVAVDPDEFARLAGRVVAHELVHVIAPRLGHTERGLMRAQWNRSVALQPHLDLDAGAARAFVTALDPAAAFCPPAEGAAEEATTGHAGEPVGLL